MPRRGEEQTRESTNGEETDEAEGVEHRGLVGDRPLVHGGGPVKDLYGRRYGNEITQEREDQGRIQRDSRDEHVMGPDQESNNGDAEYGQRHGFIAEDTLARKAAHDSLTMPMPGKNHDVNGRVGVEPEQVLKEKRVTAQCRIENAEVKQRAQEQPAQS